MYILINALTISPVDAAARQDGDTTITVDHPTEDQFIVAHAEHTVTLPTLGAIQDLLMAWGIPETATWWPIREGDVWGPEAESK